MKWLCVAALSLTAHAASAQNAEYGEELYQQFCATCHGASGEGDGPLTQMMTTSVPDLTGLAEANDGAFPMLNVLHIIDGRDDLRAHGGPMPVYGALFSETSEVNSAYADVLYRRGRILSLAYYLESLQK
ncbi:hypothetical protein AVJ23_20655 [Pseudoponticoccus marisrubri]|uniref:Cytochrome c domain-containing protein n=1 Tax=Pseudoponticoccus marisrubri TaxID=1685382 RepID=A0A0W7WEF2_9RHOB|nr:hypothetical protein AVJ23_20655 [Pseudoponticoccus marisrubri]